MDSGSFQIMAAEHRFAHVAADVESEPAEAGAELVALSGNEDIWTGDVTRTHKPMPGR